MNIKLLSSFCLTCFMAGNSFSATLYVDADLSTDCLSGDYSINAHDCSGNAGEAYNSLDKAIAAMSPGDHIVLRGDTYTGCWDIPTSKNGTSWTHGNYNKISSCNTEYGCATDEWAILDGDNNCGSNKGAVLGHVVSETNGSADLKYWWIERLEIRNGRNASGTSGYGFYGNGGPFKIRYNYIHDNKGAEGPNQCNNLPGGTSGQSWHDSVIEFNWYSDNGGTASNNNCKQITYVPSYPLTNSIQEHGLDLDESGHVDRTTGDVVSVNNIIRYNLVTGGRIGIGIKHFDFLTGRSTVDSGYDDTYAEYGTHIHHNIVKDSSGYGIGLHHDFGQVYNNILDNTGSGIRSMYDYWGSGGYTYHYKTCAYNNSVINPKDDVGYIGLGRRSQTWMDERVYAYIYNNLMDGVGSGPVGYCQEGGITPKLRCLSETLNIDYSNVEIQNNYLYRPDDNLHYRIGYDSYTTGELESQSHTSSPSNGFASEFDANNPLYEGMSGAAKYLPYASHAVEGTITIADGGRGGTHPYLSGISIPTYIGAVNPADSDWVDGVLSDLSSTIWLRSISLERDSQDSPIWLEGTEVKVVEPPRNLRRQDQ